MLQREVADRLLAEPGGADYGAMAIQVQLLADVERVLSLPPGAFRPPPKVHSAVVRAPLPATPGRGREPGRPSSGSSAACSCSAGRRSPMRSSRWPLPSDTPQRKSFSGRVSTEGGGPKRCRSPTSPGFLRLCYSFSRKSLYLPAFCPFAAIGICRPREGNQALPAA